MWLKFFPIRGQSMRRCVFLLRLPRDRSRANPRSRRRHNTALQTDERRATLRTLLEIREGPPGSTLERGYLEVWVGPLRRATCLFALPQDEITLRSALGVRLPHIVQMRSIVCDTIRLCVWC